MQTGLNLYKPVPGFARGFLDGHRLTLHDRRRRQRRFRVVVVGRDVAQAEANVKVRNHAEVKLVKE